MLDHAIDTNFNVPELSEDGELVG
jgi:hypothetical protein